MKRTEVGSLNQKPLLVAGEIAVNSEAFENLATLCDKFGSRFFASPEEKASTAFLAAKMREYGLQNVHIEPYTLYGWKNGELKSLSGWRNKTASLELLRPYLQHIPCVALAYTPSTPDEGITAEIFNLESGTRDYLLSHQKDIEGKLVLAGTYVPPGAFLVERDTINLYYATLYGHLENLGATGMILTNYHFGDLPKTGSARWGDMGEIPACGISRESAQFIDRQLKKGSVTIKLRISNQSTSNVTSYNVIGDLPGHNYPEDVIIVGGHFDGFHIAPGAMDDAAGACVVLEAARALAKHGSPFKRTIRFCCFAAEEVGLNGSTGYVLNRTNKELQKIKLMINTDTSGISAITGHGYAVCGPEELVQYLEQTLNNLGSFDRDWELPPVKHSIHPYSDHWPFFMRGIPAVSFQDMPTDPIDRLYSHTTADTVDKVSSKGMKDAALILALTLGQLADVNEFPIKHTPLEKILEIVERTEVADNLRVEKRWLREVPE